MGWGGITHSHAIPRDNFWSTVQLVSLHTPKAQILQMLGLRLEVGVPFNRSADFLFTKR